MGFEDLNENSPVRDRKVGQLAKGAVVKFPITVVTPNVARLDIIVRGQQAKFVWANGRGGIMNGLTTKQGFFLPVLLHKLLGRKADEYIHGHVIVRVFKQAVKEPAYLNPVVI